MIFHWTDKNSAMIHHIYSDLRVVYKDCIIFRHLKQSSMSQPLMKVARQFLNNLFGHCKMYLLSSLITFEHNILGYFC